MGYAGIARNNHSMWRGHAPYPLYAGLLAGMFNAYKRSDQMKRGESRAGRTPAIRKQQ